MRVLITGGATGLGQAIALKWAEKWAGKDEGLDICIADINQERGDKAVNMLTTLCLTMRVLLLVAAF